MDTPKATGADYLERIENESFRGPDNLVINAYTTSATLRGLLTPSGISSMMW
jgi:hypothetical protein